MFERCQTYDHVLYDMYNRYVPMYGTCIVRILHQPFIVTNVMSVFDETESCVLTNYCLQVFVCRYDVMYNSSFGR